MVEPAVDDYLVREGTPRPGDRQRAAGKSSAAASNPSHDVERHVDIDSERPGASADERDLRPHEDHEAKDLAATSEQQMSDQSRIWRQQQQQQHHPPFPSRRNQRQQSSSSSSSSNPSPHHYSQVTPPDPFQNVSPYQQSPPIGGPYGQQQRQQSYMSHYTIGHQQAPMTIAHTPPPHYPYSPHPYHQQQVEAAAAAAGMMSQGMHSGYQAMMPPPPMGGGYQAPGGVGGVHLYAHHAPHVQHHTSPVNASPPPSAMMGQPSASSAGTMRYPSPLSASSPGYHHPYGAAQSYSASPIYASPHQQQFAAQPYPSSREGEAQHQPSGMWWYMAPSQGTYEGGQQQYHAMQQPLPFAMGYQPQHHPQAMHTSARDPSEGTFMAQQQQQPPQQPQTPVPVYSTASPRALSRSSNTSPRSPHPALHPAPPASAEREKEPRERERDKPLMRRSYHPNPPAQRSEWVMWAGNVPSDATQEEMWRFFAGRHPPPIGMIPAISSAMSVATISDPPGTSARSSEPGDDSGVVSIFLISRSSCAFINYASDAHLRAAIARFNGVQLRPKDPRCPRLVCRVRRKDDDLRAGVGAQRGTGVHRAYVREQIEQERRDRGESEGEESAKSGLSPSSSEHVLRSSTGSGSGSLGSTTSSILTRYFPQRYFILKSLTQYDLDLSREKSVWATQKHNEGILDQAYRTSKDVYLIFSVNKSGEFYGYARMAGPVRQSEPDQRVSWASRSESSASIASLASASSPSLGPSPPVSRSGQYFPARENRMVEESPQPVSTVDESDPNRPLGAPPPTGRPPPARSSTGAARISGFGGYDPDDPASAPAELGRPHRKMTLPSPQATNLTDIGPGVVADTEGDAAPAGLHSRSQNAVPMTSPFHLNPERPRAAMKHPSRASLSSSSMVSSPLSGNTSQQQPTPQPPHTLDVLSEAEEVPTPSSPAPGDLGRDDPPSWGEQFRIEWLCTERLPFFRTKHLRNPWNHDREVKVSRDGTELEPSVGKQLIEEWRRLADPSAPPPDDTTTSAAVSTSAAGGSGKGKRTAGKPA